MIPDVSFAHEDTSVSTGAIDDDSFATASATTVATSESILALVDGRMESVVSAAGATPVDTDVSSWANDTSGIIVGTGGRVWLGHKNATDVYFVEMAAI